MKTRKTETDLRIDRILESLTNDFIKTEAEKKNALTDDLEGWPVTDPDPDPDQD